MRLLSFQSIIRSSSHKNDSLTILFIHRLRKNKIILVEQINIKVDKIIISKANTQKITNIRGTSLAVYVNKDYIHNNYVKTIRTYCGSHSKTNTDRIQQR